MTWRSSRSDLFFSKGEETQKERRNSKRERRKRRKEEKGVKTLDLLLGIEKAKLIPIIDLTVI